MISLILFDDPQVPNQPDAYEFSIRTPVTPPRWRDFDVELEAGWEAIIAELSKGLLSIRKWPQRVLITVHFQPYVGCASCMRGLLRRRDHGCCFADRPDPQLAARAILTYGYYWYNFMPLARGTAACGYTTILSLFWAAGMPISTRIPKNYQVRSCPMR